MTETWDDVNERVEADWKAETTPFERVCEIVEQTHDGQSAAEIDRYRREADTIVTHHRQAEKALIQARTASGDRWETGELTVTLGASISQRPMVPWRVIGASGSIPSATTVASSVAVTATSSPVTGALSV